jgi:MFS transporter, OFA family, oxalate/formate antiporter
VYKGWLVVIVCSCINFIMGFSYIWSIFSVRLTNVLGWSQSEAALPFIILTSVFAFLMPFSGRMQDKYGPRLVVTIGGVFAGIGLILNFFILKPVYAGLFLGFFYGLGLSLTFSSTMPTALKWFPDSKSGLVSGVVSTSAGMTAVIAGPFAFYLLNVYGTNMTFLVFGIITLFLISTFAQFLETPSDRTSQLSSKKEPNPGHSQQVNSYTQYTLKKLLKLPIFYLLWICLCLPVGTGYMFISKINLISLSLVGFESEYFLVSIFSIFSSFGRITAGLISDYLGRIKAIVLIFFIMALSQLFFNILHSINLLVIATIMLAYSYGGIFALFPSTISSFFNLKDFGLIYGLLFTAVGVAGIWGPYVAGFFYDTTFSFSTAFKITFVACLVSLIISMVIYRLQRNLASRLTQSVVSETY